MGCCNRCNPPIKEENPHIYLSSLIVKDPSIPLNRKGQPVKDIAFIIQEWRYQMFIRDHSEGFALINIVMTDSVLGAIARARGLNTLADFDRLRPLWGARSIYAAELIPVLQQYDAEIQAVKDKVVHNKAVAMKAVRDAKLAAKKRDLELAKAVAHTHQKAVKQVREAEIRRVRRKAVADYQAKVHTNGGRRLCGGIPCMPSPTPLLSSPPSSPGSTVRPSVLRSPSPELSTLRQAGLSELLMLLGTALQEAQHAGPSWRLPILTPQAGPSNAAPPQRHLPPINYLNTLLYTTPIPAYDFAKGVVSQQMASIPSAAPKAPPKAPACK
jgi:hypothetical protein